MNLTIAQASDLLKKPGTRFSGSDWKYGFPHKFYVGEGKVYNKQLKELAAEEVAAWSELTWKFFGVRFFKEGDKVMWSCPFKQNVYGYQRAGVVGERGEPLRCDTWSPDFMVN